jgi:hypothetical protein
MSHILPTHADRVARSLKRLGLRMTRTGRSFTVIDATGDLAVNSKPGMLLAEIEQWIVSRVRVHGAQLPAKRRPSA